MGVTTTSGSLKVIVARYPPASEVVVSPAVKVPASATKLPVPASFSTV